MSFSHAELLQLLGCDSLETAEYTYCGCAPLDLAGPGEVSFLVGDETTRAFRATRASLVLTSPSFHGAVPQNVLTLAVDDPYAAVVRIMEQLVVSRRPPAPPASIGPGCRVHPTACVEGTLGAGAVVGPYCWVAPGCSVGEAAVLEAHVSLYPCVAVGAGSRLLAGAVVGGRGFGFRSAAEGLIPVPHFGGVVIGADCEIGANTVVAAGFLAPTRIGDRVRLDSLVQIGHNCRVGNDVYLAAQSGLAGSVIVEDGVEMGGGAQVAGHLVLGRGCRVAAKSGVTRSVPPGVTVAGFPAQEIGLWRRMVVQSRQCNS